MASMEVSEESGQSSEGTIIQIDFDEIENVQGSNEMIETSDVDCESLSSHEGSDFIDTKVPGLLHFQQPLQSDNLDFGNDEYWACFGAKVPAAEIVFMSQLTVAGCIIFCCLLNLSLQIGNSELWGILLSACAGYLLPSPSLEKTRKLINKKDSEVEISN